MKKIFAFVLACLMVFSLTGVCYAAEPQTTGTTDVELSIEGNEAMPLSGEWGSDARNITDNVEVSSFDVENSSQPVEVRMIIQCRPVSGSGSSTSNHLIMNISGEGFNKDIAVYPDNEATIHILGSLNNGVYTVTVYNPSGQGSYIYAWTAYSL